MQEVRATAAKHWTERAWYCHNRRWMQSSKEGTTASRSGSFKNGQEWGEKCFEDLDHRRMGRPATRTWSTDFLLSEPLANSLQIMAFPRSSAGTVNQAHTGRKQVRFGTDGHGERRGIWR